MKRLKTRLPGFPLNALYSQFYSPISVYKMLKPPIPCFILCSAVPALFHC